MYSSRFPAQIVFIPIVDHQALIEGFDLSLVFLGLIGDISPFIILLLLARGLLEINPHKLFHLFGDNKVEGGFLRVANSARETIDGEILRALEAETVSTGSEDRLQEYLKTD